MGYSRYTAHKEGAAIHLDGAAGHVVVILDPFVLRELVPDWALVPASLRGSLAVLGHVSAAATTTIGSVPVIRAAAAWRGGTSIVKATIVRTC